MAILPQEKPFRKKGTLVAYMFKNINKEYHEHIHNSWSNYHLDTISINYHNANYQRQEIV